MLNPKITIINLTPHAINFKNTDGVDYTFLPSGQVARCASEEKEDFFASVALGLPVVKITPGKIEGLPEPVQFGHIIYLVSSMVAQHPDVAKIRGDVMAPNTGSTAIRENGQIVAVRSFQRF